jgi:hypothetical protein
LSKGDRETMPILRDITITLTAEEVIASPGGKPIRDSVLQHAEEAITLGQALWQPAAVYDWLDVREVRGECAILSSPVQPAKEAVLHVGPKANLLANAERALVSVATIGPALEQQVRELQTAGEGLKAYMLDSAGVVALGSIGEAIRCLVEEVAADQGWGVSPALSPGSLVGWPLRGQRELCALLPLDSIGVELNGHCVLEPFKSTSAVVGLGPGYNTTTVGSTCKYCALAKTCWRRREDPS